MAQVTKKQVLAHLGVYAVVRGVVDAIRPAEETSAESASYDKMTFDVVEESLEAKAKGCRPKCCKEGK